MIQTWRNRLKNTRVWRLITTSLIVFLALGSLCYLIYRERDVLLSYPWQFRLEPLLAAFLLFSIALFLTAVVWIWIVRSLGVKVDFFRQLNYFYISVLARRLPGTLWNVAYLAKMYQNEGFSPWLTSLASGFELVVTITSGIAVTLLFGVEVLMHYPLGGVGVAVLAASCLLFLYPPVTRMLFHRFGSQATPPPTRSLLKWVGVYFIIRLINGLIVYMVINIVYPLALDNLPYITGIWALVGLISTMFLLSLSNLGVTELSFSLLIGAILPSSIAVVVALGQRILFILFEIADALVIVSLNAIIRKK
jgi:hypothetical protein